MVEIRRMTQLGAALLKDLIVGYTTSAMYVASKEESPEATRIELRLALLEQPVSKVYPALTEATLEHYTAIARQGHAFGAFIEDRCVGLALSEVSLWNASLLVHEFHVAAAHQGQGIGRLLMETLARHAQEQGLRCLVCETQTTNVSAIRFYRAQGFVLDGIDFSYYTNQDLERGEIAVFLKKKLSPPENAQ